ncbi:MAG: YdiU family protein [Chitinophagaceae bacterium]
MIQTNAHLSSLIFNNSFIQTFPGDHSGDTSPRHTPGVLYSTVHPTPVAKPELLAWSSELARELELSQIPDENDIAILGGNLVTPAMEPYAACYAGHQFGSWAGQLGDGRAITLGDIELNSGLKEFQLKGAGPTPYSRRADGRAVLRSSVREYLMSEAMFHLGVPTTRALGIVTTGDAVLRDMFYDGNAAHEKGAIVMRVAPSFLRFGNFEMLAARADNVMLLKLANWTIDNFFPHLQGDNKIIRWFEEVVERTAHMIVEWTRVGFVHGVMNTDNMSILGLTIDYGPYSFLDHYDPMFTPNTTDLPGRRYAFGKQAAVAKWNLGRLAGALAPLFQNTDELQTSLDSFDEVYWKSYYNMMGKKLGLETLKQEDAGLITSLEKMLSLLKPDMTIFFRLLSSSTPDTNVEALMNHFSPAFYNEPEADGRETFALFMKAYFTSLTQNKRAPVETAEAMNAVNPKFILRNYMLLQAIEDLDRGNAGLFEKLHEQMKHPYAEDQTEFFTRRPEWAGQKAGSSMLSCSS